MTELSAACVDVCGKAHSHDSVRQLFDLNNAQTGGHRLFLRIWLNLKGCCLMSNVTQIRFVPSHVFKD